MSIMELVIILLILIVLIGVVNERFLHIQGDIALVLFSVLICGVLYGIGHLPGCGDFAENIRRIGDFGFEGYLIDSVLCFMLFAGASKVNIRKFRQNVKAISLLAVFTTVISSFIYGLLFWLIAVAAGIGLDFWTCVLLGCIVSPTDPIAATGILNKLGLSKNVTSVIESESLFNDGTGVALFVFVKSIVAHSGESNFFWVMLREVAGAFAVAFLVSILLFQLMKLTRDPVRHLLISFLDVALAYGICERMGFSGVIASVLCGMLFAYQRDRISGRLAAEDEHHLYLTFWETAESILNAVLFAMIGISVLNLDISSHILVLIPAVILCVTVSRFLGVGLSSLAVGADRLPGSYSISEFVSLMTWSALKGGLSLAMAMSTKEFLAEEEYLCMLDAAYITILFTVIVQGLTMKKVYFALERHKAARIQKRSQKIRNRRTTDA